MFRHPSLDGHRVKPNSRMEVWNAALLPFREPVEPVKASPTQAQEENFSKLLPITMTRWAIAQSEGQRQP
jgi:hypothetical protein